MVIFRKSKNQALAEVVPSSYLAQNRFIQALSKVRSRDQNLTFRYNLDAIEKQF